MINTNEKYDVNYQKSDVQLKRTEIEENGIIPSSLAELTYMIIAAHQANGDLAWLSDIVQDAEHNPDAVKTEIDIKKYTT